MHRSVIRWCARTIKPCSVQEPRLLDQVRRPSEQASCLTPTSNGFRTIFFKTELELGRCLRLPQEGPCECELYLTCAKFVTTPAYAPRLRRRRRIEQELVENAAAHRWQREVERHQCTIRRLEQLLTDLREPIEGPEAIDS